MVSDRFLTTGGLRAVFAELALELQAFAFAASQDFIFGLIATVERSSLGCILPTTRWLQAPRGGSRPGSQVEEFLDFMLCRPIYTSDCRFPPLGMILNVHSHSCPRSKERSTGCSLGQTGTAEPGGQLKRTFWTGRKLRSDRTLVQHQCYPVQKSVIWL